MQKIKVEYLGYDGEGRTMTLAKQDAARKVEDLTGSNFQPFVVEGRTAVGTVFRDKYGYGYMYYSKSQGVTPRVLPNPMTTSGYHNRKDVIQRVIFHVAENDWTIEQGLDFSMWEPWIERETVRELETWASWQIGYQYLKLVKGHDDDHCHRNADTIIRELGVEYCQRAVLAIKSKKGK